MHLDLLSIPQSGGKNVKTLFKEKSERETVVLVLFPHLYTFMAAWREEEEDAARHHQKKRKTARLWKLLSYTKASVEAPNQQQPIGLIFRALSLRNLISGCKCGRVYTAGAGPSSPSRGAANWLSSRLSRSAETRRRYGWLRMVFPGARLFRAPIWCTSGGGGK